MRYHRMLKTVLVVIVILSAILLYELAGIFAGYRSQPGVSETTKKETRTEDFYRASKEPERAAIIEDNGEALRQRLRLIQNAQEEIILSTFAFHADESGKIMIGALLEAAERGVQVRILTDGMESWTAMEGNPYFYAMSSHENIDLKLYNRVNPLKPWKMMGRMHDKYLIADGQIYLLGGRNTYDYFLGDFPGHKNFDRDVLVVCEEPGEDNSVRQLQNYFETLWQQKDCTDFHGSSKLQERESVKEAAKDAKERCQAYYEEHKDEICDRDYGKNTFETQKITLIANPVHTQAKEPVVWYQLGELMKHADRRVKIHTPYIICNDMMYETWDQIAKLVPQFTIMTNSAANNGNPFGAADYAKNKERILDTGAEVWEYEGGYSYHGKSVLIDDDISIVGSFNMDMRSVYLDTELMLVICSKEVNQQLEKNMDVYERTSRQALGEDKYHNPYHVEPIELTPRREKRIYAVQKLLGWARFLF